MRTQILGADGATKEVVGGFGDALPTVQIGGDYFEWLRKGYIFHGSVGTAAEIQKYDDATNMPRLWNPADSGKVIIPIAVNVSAAAEGTVVISGLCLNYHTNVGSALGTAAPFSVFTEVASVNLLLGSNKTAKAKWSPTTNTATAAGTLLMALGMGEWTDGTPANSGLYSGMVYKFDGTLALLPGTAIGICSTVATSTTFNSSIVYAELPYDATLWG